MTNITKDKKRIQVQVDRDLYNDSNEVLNDIGISQATLINALLKKVVAEGRVPFELSQSKEERLSFEIAREVRKANIPEIKDPEAAKRYLLENGDDSFDEEK
ncbi:type II toxin-antitoxin system RelB/DinJ family antitoxin [Lentilactobacillus kisonensis]|uniref:Addiction module antitoxin, RelB/DinJ family n=2 Tax=Lentilactobacillus kisonensis TaxID=481722 RepID=H1LK95_9LACO|nr:type II toxin-antitoxin system RelB/DinJ family antitoxin [Lentilactobacillus kisonensis]EHO47569.1 addiction module antitoxin, RelB/DinJ family [Lentilactobacillus kisonensis F0435]KRL22782.1 addiction module antitoxin, RelB DinJ family [Lentilactobacillus kisonensis DSM 19906 = JCM 15041]